MTDLKTYQVYAVSLLADLQAAAKIGVPRREVLIDWLDDFLVRSKRRGFEMVFVTLKFIQRVDERFDVVLNITAEFTFDACRVMDGALYLMIQVAELAPVGPSEEIFNFLDHLG